MNVLALVAALIAVGAWFGIRWAETSKQMETDLAAYLLSIPADEWIDE